MKDCKVCETARINYAVLIDFIMDKVQAFTVFDFAIFKTCLFSLGLLFGALFSEKIKKFAPVVVIITIVSYIYLIYKVFFEKD